MGGPRKTKNARHRARENTITSQSIVAHDNTKMEEREAFAAWLITPPDEREPGTQRALAAELGVTPETLSVWKRDAAFMRSVYLAAGRHVHIEWLGPIMTKQYDIAVSDSDLVTPGAQTSAAKFLVGIMDKAMDFDTALAEIEAKPLEDMTLDELRAELGEIIDLIDDQLDEDVANTI